jgi:P27 family predicted phage terminase small subunit
MRGRKPHPTHLRLLRGNPGRRPIHAEPEPAVAAEVPDVPPFLEGYAADEWHVVAAELHRLGLLTVVDVASLAAYCVAYSDWRTARELLAKMAANDPVMKGLMVKTQAYGAPMQNPLVKLARNAAGDMVRYAAEFGFSPAARSRIKAGPDAEQSSKFGELLAG